MTAYEKALHNEVEKTRAWALAEKELAKKAIELMNDYKQLMLSYKKLLEASEKREDEWKRLWNSHIESLKPHNN